MLATTFHAKTFIETTDLSYADWLVYRRNGIGGSDVAAICGLSRWKTPLHVYLEKLGEAPEEEPSEAAEWGTRLEPLIAEKFVERHPEWAVTEKPVIYMHPETEWALGNLDRMIICPKRGRGILEIKTASEYLKQSWDHENIPDYYFVQLQWYFYVTGLEWGYFATLIGGNKYREYEVFRDDEMIDQLVRLVGDFWHQHILTRTRPLPDGSEAATTLLNRLHPEAQAAKIELQDIEQIEHYLAKKKALHDVKEEVTELENRIKALLGDHEIGIAGPYTIKWSNRIRNGIDSKLLKQDFPEIYQRCAKQTQYRHFQIMKGD